MAHELPKLPYSYDALEPHIDARTMEIHYTKHHQAYVTNLNGALDKHAELHKKNLDDLLRGIGSVPEDIRGAVRNNGGGHHNHSLFWTIMKKGGGGEPTGALADGVDVNQEPDSSHYEQHHQRELIEIKRKVRREANLVSRRGPLTA